MSIKSISVLTILFAATSASANGGLTIDNVNEHMNAQNWVQTSSVPSAIITQAPVDAFTQYQSENQTLVNTDSLKQSHDGQS